MGERNDSLELSSGSTLTGAEKKLKRFILTCGFKQYGVHIGAAKQPLLESDPLLENGAAGASWPPIFYYEQQRILAAGNGLPPLWRTFWGTPEGTS
jgi:hypothetical protein